MAPSHVSMLEPHTPAFLTTEPHAIVRGEGVTLWTVRDTSIWA